MAIPIYKQHAAKPSIESGSIHRHIKQLDSWHCLILSGSAERRELMGQSAFAAGWQTVSCDDANAALMHLCRTPVKLAFLDLQCPHSETAAIRGVAEHIIWTGGILLIVNADSADTQTEAWARQLGVWSYLPGMLPHSDLSSLCTQAREVTEKLNTSKVQ